MKNAKIDSKKIVTAVICTSIVLAVFVGLNSIIFGRVAAHGREISLVFAGCNEAGDTGIVLDAADGTPADGSRVRVYLANFSSEREEPYSCPATLRPGTTDTVGAGGLTGAFQVDVYHQQWRTLAEDPIKADVIIVVDQQNAGGEGYTISWKFIIPAGTTGGAIYFPTPDTQRALQKIPTPVVDTGKITWTPISDPNATVYGYRVYECDTETGTYYNKTDSNVTSAPWEYTNVVANYYYKLSVLYKGIVAGTPLADDSPSSPGVWTNAGAVESLYKGPAAQYIAPVEFPTVTTKPATGVLTTNATLNMDYTVGTYYASVNISFNYKKTADPTWSSTSWVQKTVSGSYSENLPGLLAGTPYQFNATLKYDSTIIYGIADTFTTLITAPTVTTKPATGVLTTTATLNMDYTVGTYAPVNISFNYKKTADPTWSSTSWVQKTVSGSYSENLPGLLAGTPYQFNATLKYDSTIIYGIADTFTTTTVTAPTVTTTVATGVGTTTATLNMDYTVGSYTSVQVRFDYKKTTDSAWSSTSWETKTSSGSHSESLTGLSSGTEYQFNATLKYDSTTIYSSVLTFNTTMTAPTVTTTAATGVGTTTATLNMDYTVGDYSSVQVRFDYKKTADTAWTSTSWETKTSPGNHSESLTGLSSGTEYQFNATLKYDSTTIYGSILTFTTTTPPDTTAPAAPTGLTATSGNGVVVLSWNANTESDLAGYNVYRTETSGSGYVKISTALVSGTSYSDTGLTNGVTYYYVVTAVDSSGNPSGYSNEVSAKPEKPPENKPGFIPSAGIAGTGLALLAAALIIYKKRRK